MKDCPRVGDEIEALKEGILVARELAIRAGMKPGGHADGENDDFSPFPPSDDNDDIRRRHIWFYQPFKYHSNLFGGQKQLGDEYHDCDDDDDCDCDNSESRQYGDSADNEDALRWRTW